MNVVSSIVIWKHSSPDEWRLELEMGIPNVMQAKSVGEFGVNKTKQQYASELNG